MEPKRRPPPRLRTKTGCFMCRKRRKKCDERKPLCGDCTKYRFQCVWPSLLNPNSTIKKEESNSDEKTLSIVPTIVRNEHGGVRRPQGNSPFSDDSSKIATLRSPLYGLPGIRTSIEHNLSMQFTQRYMPLLNKDHAHPALHQHTGLILQGSQQSTLMDSLFAATAAFLGNTNPKFMTLSIKYYNSAISSVRRAILDDSVKGDEDWILTATNFMCLFEATNGRALGTPSGAVSHLEGFGRVLSVRIASDLRGGEKKRMSPSSRISAESFVFFKCTTSLYYADIDRVADIVSWEDLEVYLNFDIIPNAKPYENSHLLGFDWQIYKICFDIVRLSHKLPLDTTSRVEAEDLEKEILNNDKKYRRLADENKDDSRICRVMHEALMFTLASQILVFKILHPATKASQPKIKQLVGETMDLIKILSKEKGCLPYHAWPIAIASCAVTTEDQLLFLQQTHQTTWIESYCGNSLRLKRAVENFWEAYEIGKEKCTTLENDEKDILDVLICGRGLFEIPASTRPSLDF